MAKNKSRKMRGSNTYGHGIKGRRGAGRRGGRGDSGLGKHHKMWMLKYGKKWGNYGFTSHHPKEEIEIMNVGELNERIDDLVAHDFAKFNGENYEIDLKLIGIKKLLGKGKVEKKMTVKVKYASKNAVKKIEEKGGEVINA